MAVTAIAKRNSKYLVKGQSFVWDAGMAIFAGHPVALGVDGKVYHLENAAVDGYDVVGVSKDSVASGAKCLVESGIVELPLKSGVTTAKNGTLVYVDDNGEVTVTNTDHKAGKVVSTENSGYVFVAIDNI